MNEKGIPILSRSTNVTTISNIGLYDAENKQGMNERRYAIADMISTSRNNY